jgi:hypothetical protein
MKQLTTPRMDQCIGCQSCSLARSVYSEDMLSKCLSAVGYETLAGNIPGASEHIRRLRWKVRAETGFNPDNFSIPKRFYQVEIWKGHVHKTYLDDGSILLECYHHVSQFVLSQNYLLVHKGRH